MQTFALEIWDDESSHVTFYTVRKLGDRPEDDARQTETDKFFDDYEQQSAHTEALDRLTELLLGVMGETYGASDQFFTRFVNQIHELPPRPGRQLFEIGLDYRQFPLRLFCLRISETIVILFNGGEKTSQITQDSPSLSLKFKEAQDFGRRIEAAIRAQEISIYPRTIKSAYGEEAIIL